MGGPLIDGCSLRDTTVIALDCQSTGANPAHGHLLEIGWVAARASQPAAAPTSFLVRLPDGAGIPSRVQALTGIAMADLVAAVEPRCAWEALAKAAAAARNGDATALAIVHHAQFEKPFLQHLHETHGAGAPFPLEIICTREIAQRLLPNLPRRGLSALVGYFGATPPMLRRCSDHISATVWVWRHLVELLDKQFGIRTFDALRQWLANPRPGKRCHEYPLPRAMRLALPRGPGVYRFLRRNGDILYIGKAASLRQRVNSYFRKQTRVPDRLLEMLTQAHSVETTTTSSALEAALLESDEIKKHSPRYNVALRGENRSLCFASTDFSTQSPVPERGFPLGPFPAAAIVTAFAELCSVLRGAELTTEAICSVLTVRPENAPSVECFAQGLLYFRAECLAGFGADALESSLLRVGDSLWEQRLAERDRQDEESAEELPTPEKDVAPPAWDSSRVARALKENTLRAAHAKRRAEWLCDLSECSLIWRGDECRSLIIEQGKLVQAGNVDEDTMPPVPPGQAKATLERQRCFDIATYDRLVVLTAELRRLVSESTQMWLRLGRERVLDKEGVSRALQWI
ncbi:MAG TPA: GIY-YIG nuclease family protein [Planctomycetota bacterium]